MSQRQSNFVIFHLAGAKGVSGGEDRVLVCIFRLEEMSLKGPTVLQVF